MLCQSSFVETFEMSPLNENYMILNGCGNRSVSPRSELRGIRLFRVISKKLSRRSKQHSVNTDSESRSSSSDSCSSSHNSRANQSVVHSSRSISPNEISSSGSESGSDIQSRSRRHHHSTSAESLRKLFQNLNLYSRSQSCANAKEANTKRKTSKKSAPKSILRTPTSYTYVKGLSGLPTQRIPVHQIKTLNNCQCSMYR